MKDHLLSIFKMVEQASQTGNSTFSNKCIIHKDDTFTIIIEPRMINKLKLTEKDILSTLLDNETRRNFYCIEMEFNDETYLVIRGDVGVLGFETLVTDEYNHSREIHKILNVKDITIPDNLERPGEVGNYLEW